MFKKNGSDYPGQTVVIGDTMAHDILGGSLVHMDTCLVKRGLHHNKFKHATTPAEVDKALDILVRQYNNIRPKYLVDNLVWGRTLPDRKHKKRAHKANRKADQKRIMRNYAVIHGQPAAENDVPATPAV